MSAELETLKTQVATSIATEQSAVILIQEIGAKLAAAGNSAEAAELQSLADSLKTSSEALAAEVTAKTAATATNTEATANTEATT